MFGFLKERIKKVLGRIAKTEAKGPAEQEQKKGIIKGIIKKIATIKLSPERFEKVFWDLELALLESNTAVEVIEHIKKEIANALVGKDIKRSEIETLIKKTLKKAIKDLFVPPKKKITDMIAQKEEKPFTICFFGINGSGKTTTIAKFACLFQKNNISCVLAASDTFRAAAIDQLEAHANRLGIKIIKHDYGADPAAVAFDAIAYAKAHNIDVVLIDTAGRMHSNINLIDEMKKIVRVAKPDIKIFVGESITGNDCIEQAKKFNDEIGIDGIVLTKVDIDEKGGAAISVSYVTKKPILFIGTGQGYDALTPFSVSLVLNNLGID